MYDRVKQILGNDVRHIVPIARNFFGLSVLDEIHRIVKDRELIIDFASRLGIDLTSKIVVCGYNGFESQQHLGIIESLRHQSFSNVQFVFPITYGGSDHYKELVKRELKNSGLNYVTIEQFLTIEEVAVIRVIADCFCQLQITDAFSGSMQEHLYAGSNVITGEWLDYCDLKLNDVQLVEVSSVSDIGSCLARELAHPTVTAEQKSSNKERIYRMSSWRNTIAGWDLL